MPHLFITVTIPEAIPDQCQLQPTTAECKAFCALILLRLMLNHRKPKRREQKLKGAELGTWCPSCFLEGSFEQVPAQTSGLVYPNNLRVPPHSQDRPSGCAGMCSLRKSKRLVLTSQRSRSLMARCLTQKTTTTCWFPSVRRYKPFLQKLPGPSSAPVPGLLKAAPQARQRIRNQQTQKHCVKDTLPLLLLHSKRSEVCALPRKVWGEDFG